MRCIAALCAAASLASGAFASVAAAGTAINVCHNGVAQSPIDLQACRKEIDHEYWNMPLERPTLKTSYIAPDATVKTICEADGCHIHVAPKSDSPVSNMFEVPGVGSYALDHCVVRIPSEHTVNGQTYPMEVQCHHTMEGTDHKRKGILSTLYEVGGKNTASGFIQGLIPAEGTGIPADGASLNVAGFNFQAMGSAGPTRYHSYTGSQTLGDCAENTDWYVMYDASGVSQEQLDTLKKSMAKGWKPARLTQPLYGRHPEACHLNEIDENPSAAGSTVVGVFSLAVALASVFVGA